MSGMPAAYTVDALGHEQYNSKTGKFTLPKNGKTRRAPLTAPAREALLALPKNGEFCFAHSRPEPTPASARFGKGSTVFIVMLSSV